MVRKASPERSSSLPNNLRKRGDAVRNVIQLSKKRNRLPVEQLISIFAAELESSLEDVDDFADLEEQALEVGNETVRRVLESRLRKQANAEHELKELIRGVPISRHQIGTGTYYSLVGTLEVQRYTYRFVGDRN